jgi:hypothetical protein
MGDNLGDVNVLEKKADRVTITDKFDLFMFEIVIDD